MSADGVKRALICLGSSPLCGSLRLGDISEFKLQLDGSLYGFFREAQAQRSEESDAATCAERLTAR
jgi:hypothetical protein